MKELSVILCSYNEEKNIRRTIVNLSKKKGVKEIIIIDDNSSDKTEKIVKKINNKKVKFFSRKFTKGFASAFIYGIMISRYQYIMRFDVDMYKNIDYFVDVFLSNVNKECVIFSRYVYGGKDLRNNFRKISSIIVNKLCQNFLSNKIKDYTSCVLFFNKKILQDIEIKNTYYANFIIHFTFNLIKKKKLFLEVPFVQDLSTEKNSKSAPNFFGFIVNGFFYLITIFYCLLLKFTK